MTDERNKGQAILWWSRMLVYDECLFKSLQKRDAGDRRLQNAEYEDAIKDFNKSVELLCQYPWLLVEGCLYLKAILEFNIGFCESQRNNYGKAIGSLSTCLDCCQDHMEALQLRAACWRKVAKTAPHRERDNYLGRAILDYESLVDKYNHAQAHPGSTQQ
jgi:tetratricopeptide (TPR) repeat protein